MKRSEKKFPAISMILAAAWVFSSCGTAEYPEEAEALPTYTTPYSAQVIIETDTSPVVTTTPRRTTPETTTTTTQIFGTGDYTSETTAATVPGSQSSAVTASVPSLDEVPEVGISDYYKGTQTSRTLPVTTSVVTTSAVTTVSGPQTSVVTPIPDIDLEDDEWLLEDPVEDYDEDETITESTAAVSEEYEVVADNRDVLHERLTDGRKSKYTGRDIISHPQCYYSLDEKKRQVYDRTVSALMRHETGVTFTDEDALTFDEFFDLYYLIYNDEYRLFYISNTIEYYVDPKTGYLKNVELKYNYNRLQAENMQQEIDARCDEIMSAVTPQMSDYEIVKLIHDAIVTGCTYKEVKDMNTVYGCLVNGEALCQGYSRSFMYLCGEAGIVSYGVFGEANGPHMWNIVEMDGEYYHVDCTWDDPILTPEDREFIRYYYFLVNDSDIVGVTHIPDSTYYSYPVSAARDNYYKREGFYAESGEQGVNLLAVCAAEALEDGRKDAAVRFADRKSYDAAYSKLFDNKEILDVFAYVNSVSPRKVLDSRYVRYANNEELIIHISMIYDYE